jgi:peptide/nickel transport system substrate-binding protein
MIDPHHGTSRPPRWRLALVALLTLGLGLGLAQAQRTLVIGQHIEFTSLDPHRTSSPVDGILLGGVFDSLITRDGVTGIMYPHLATSWSVSDDGLVWTFELRDDVTFHDGDPFDAEAAAFNFLRIIDPATQSQNARFDVGPLVDARAAGSHTLELVFSEPYGPLPSALAQYPFGMVSPRAAQALGVDFGRAPVGTGPYRFVEWVDGQSVTIERNPDYAWGNDMFHGDEVHYDRITFRFIAENSTRAAALRTGELDVAIWLTARDFVSFADDDRFATHASSRWGYPPASLHINVSKAPTDDVRVRRALIHATDMDLVIDVVYEGIVPRSGGLVSITDTFYDPEAGEMYPYDPERAGELLDEAGWTRGSDGFRTRNGERLRIVYLTLPQYAAEAEVIEAEWRRIGIDVEVLVQANPQQQATAQSSAHNVVYSSWGGFDPSSLRGRFGSENVGTGWNFSFYANPEVDELFRRSVAETDPARRAEIFSELQMALMGDAVLIPLNNTSVLTAARSGITGFEPLDANGFWSKVYNLREE